MTTALITGASAGIGAAFVRRLAAARYDLILTARDTARLDQSAAALRDEWGANVEVLPADLADAAGTALVEARLADPSRPVDVLVNNAGFDSGRSFMNTAVEVEEAKLNVMVRAVLRLSHAALPGMVRRGRGAIINVSSVAGFIPSGSYGAAKAWVTSFSEGLAVEVGRHGVKVLALCPGFTHTEFRERANLGDLGLPEWLWLEADQIVDAALRDLRRGATLSVPGSRYKVLSHVARHTPRALLGRIARQFDRLD